MALAAAERAALCDLLEKLGPQAPTLCEGWETRHLAAHLVTRDRRPDALPGNLTEAVTAFTQRTRRLEAATLAEHDYADLLRLLRAGPPALFPLGLPVLGEVANIHEFFVHHEDVRRPQGLPPRALGAAMDEALWRRLRVLAPVLLRRLQGVGVSLHGPEGRVLMARPGEPAVTLSGDVGELLLYLFNRRADARVEVSGPEPARAALAATRLGV